MFTVKSDDIKLLAVIAICLALAGMALRFQPSVEDCLTYDARNPATQSSQSPQGGPKGVPSVPISDGESNADKCNDNRGHQWWSEIGWPSSGFWQAVFNGILIIVGGLQWLIYSRMRNDSVVRERAFIFKHDYSHMIGARDHTGFPALQVGPVWQNSGATPALRVWMQVNVEVRSDSLPTDFTFPDRWQEGESRERHPAFIAPHANMGGSPRDISASDLRRAAARTSRIFIYGWVEYDDIFSSDIRHRTEFCDEIIPSDFSQIPGTWHLSFHGHGRHNGVDEGCYKRPMKYVPPDHTKQSQDS